MTDADLEEALDLKFRQTPNSVRRLFASKLPDDRDKATAALARLAMEAIREQSERDARTERPAAPSVGWEKREP
ncbi:hypothetical protein [Henriciella sp.]|uniref:hypothetical protein n=1 Tax=Henriciella sp. TaxID=1968823 RepID=UPI000C0FA287|nr:hypothetical protein [Henriciella sp.]PHR83090.1 MAG: hypothetical protein COA64_00090 [Henriciella sp.]